MFRVAIALVLCLLVAEARAGAWLQDRGETDAFLTSTFTYGDHGFDEDGQLVTVPEYRKFELNATIEYGVRSWVTAVLKGELREETRASAEGGIDAAVSNAFASVAGGARFRIYETDDAIVSTELTAFSGGFTSLGSLAPSDGPGVEARAQLGLSRTVFGRRSFVDLQAAYRLRTEKDDADEIRIDLTAGTQFRPRWSALAQTFSTIEIGEDTHYHKVSASVVRRMTRRLYFEAGGIATVYGRNALQEFGGRAGFRYSF